MTTFLACTLTLTIGGPVFWCWGHRTARIRHVRIPAGCYCRDTAAVQADEDAFIAAFRARLDAELGPATDPDDESSAA